MDKAKLTRPAIWLEIRSIGTFKEIFYYVFSVALCLCGEKTYEAMI